MKKNCKDVFHSGLVQNACFSKPHEFQLLKPVFPGKIEKTLPFDKTGSNDLEDCWIHFYIHDYKFECIWNSPDQYLNKLKKAKGVISPDYSLCRDLPLAMQIWNTYRNRALTYWLQRMGVAVLPNVRWGDERSYAFAFEGLHANGAYAVGAYGNIKRKKDRYYFEKGLNEMISRLAPAAITFYGSVPQDILNYIKPAQIQVLQANQYFGSGEAGCGGQ